MQLVEVTERTPFLIRHLVDVWKDAVRATHLFLSEDAIQMFKQYVPQALQEVPLLIAAQHEQEEPVAFMGIEGPTLQMLFIAQAHRGKGLGKILLQEAITRYAVRELTVNEQNPLAYGFYAHMGFQVYRRTERDEQGNPYPLLYMRLSDIPSAK